MTEPNYEGRIRDLNQIILNRDVQIEELARALRWISENGFGDNGRECAERATAALSTPSVGGSLAEENERLREALCWVRDWINHEVPIPTRNATTALGVVLDTLAGCENAALAARKEK